MLGSFSPKRAKSGEEVFRSNCRFPGFLPLTLDALALDPAPARSGHGVSESALGRGDDIIDAPRATMGSGLPTPRLRLSGDRRRQDQSISFVRQRRRRL